MQNTTPVPVDSLDPCIGEIIGGYRLEECIGEGGMGAVFTATHRILGRKAAVKILAPSFANDPNITSRFFHEAKAVSGLHHPNVVDIVDFIASENRLAYVMEFVDGSALSEVIRAGPSTLEIAAPIAIQLAGALTVVHQAGIVHRDLKPSNILVCDYPRLPISGTTQVKILDFGIAQVPEFRAECRTRSGVVMGTPAYMAPEQLYGEAVSPATDIYALAEILYEMLAGRRLFDGNNREILQAKLSSGPRELWLPEEIAERTLVRSLLGSCLSMDATRRPPLDHVRRELARILHRASPPPSRLEMEGTETKTDSESETRSEVEAESESDAESEGHVQRPWVPALLVGLILIGVLVGGGLWLKQFEPTVAPSFVAADPPSPGPSENPGLAEDIPPPPQSAEAPTSVVAVATPETRQEDVSPASATIVADRKGTTPPKGRKKRIRRALRKGELLPW